MATTPDTPRTFTVRKQHVLPIYLTAAFVLVWAVVLPLARWWHIGLCAASAVALFFVLRRLFPDTVTEVELPPDDTGLDSEARDFLARLAEDDAAITDEDVSARVRDIADLTRRIYSRVAEQPTTRPRIRRFANQYLPMTLKLLDHYAALERSGISGDTVAHSREEIARVLIVVRGAFEKQLDALYQAQALDISTDITVLEAILKQNGLSGSDFDSSAK